MYIVKKMTSNGWLYYTGKGDEWAQERVYALRMNEEKALLLASAIGGKIESVKE